MPGFHRTPLGSCAAANDCSKARWRHAVPINAQISRRCVPPVEQLYRGKRKFYGFGLRSPGAFCPQRTIVIASFLGREIIGRGHPRERFAIARKSVSCRLHMGKQATARLTRLRRLLGVFPAQRLTGNAETVGRLRRSNKRAMLSPRERNDR